MLEDVIKKEQERQKRQKGLDVQLEPPTPIVLRKPIKAEGFLSDVLNKHSAELQTPFPLADEKGMREDVKREQSLRTGLLHKLYQIEQTGEKPPSIEGERETGFLTD